MDVEHELDDAPRSVEVPDDLAAALESDAAAKAFFDELSYSRQRWFTESVTSAKKPETRERRVVKAMEMLRERRVGNEPVECVDDRYARRPVNARRRVCSSASPGTSTLGP